MILDCCAFPWFLVSDHGIIIGRGTGSLYQLPLEAESPSELQFYAKLKVTGWSECPLGWAIYANQLDALSTGIGVGGLLVLPGLQVRGGKRPNDKRPGLRQFCEKQLIVDHVSALVESSSTINNQFDLITRQHIHEVRGLNASLYNTALELEGLLSVGYSQPATRNLAGNLLALTQVLSARMDFMNFQTDDTLLGINLCPVQVHPKFLKMVRSFRVRADKSEIELRLEGQSVGSVYGPKGLLDLVAYLMLDNALKYSPANEVILVYIEENEDVITVGVTSTGPNVEPEELPLLFEQGFRGKAARESGISGSGIGLHALKRLIEEGFSGSIGVETAKLGIGLRHSQTHQQISFEAVFPRWVF